MNIKLLPFDVAVKKVKEQGGLLAQFTDDTQIAGIHKKYWIELENKILTANKKYTYYYNTCYFSFPKCCCEVIEE